MKVVYYSSMVTGSGHIVQGISIANAFKRAGADVDYTILHCGGFGKLAERMNVDHILLPTEDEVQLGTELYKHSAVYTTLLSLQPDVLIVDLSWFTLYRFIETLVCMKIFLCRQISDDAFSIPLPGGALEFEPEQYDRLIATEPFNSKIEMQQINPIIIRTPDEILPRPAALEVLQAGDGKKICLFAFNGKPDEFNDKKKLYSYLEDEGWNMIYTSNFRGGIFPVVDYFNAVDMIICGAGYNAFWEAMYFEKETIFCPVKRRFEDQRLRVDSCSDYRFTENGADQLADIIIGG